MKLFKKERPCPVCPQGKIEVAALHNGTECSHCRSFVEIDFRFSAGLPLIMAIACGIAFNQGFGWAGYFLAALLVFYTSGYRMLFCGYLPLKVYADEN